MPHTIPALKIPLTTEQLPKQKAKKPISERTNEHELWLIGECVPHVRFQIKKKTIDLFVRLLSQDWATSLSPIPCSMERREDPMPRVHRLVHPAI